ncbi:nucleotide-binding universal stress UspA family protein [Halohasta litchfieldiae]|jgi:nucleotide-binding universal stress UspA family protein|uniref:Nucleotide-binding universal stress protein, UspA family n=1 Tax=Halohasta litchfieldiae TaxID=1073996 RepID=A0A1H6XIY3_9EURY|nr:universal stress protein [Halohasta litchfieldiae]ATW87448.1 nucleotide-binding universal stress UspA family protein [Halohasta litchfieldiae]SEJ26667.1 Nucleotide-binding universal stress protein, UspA family [Halohasta litchfieldiae]
MTLVVPYDNSELSKTALIRAAQFSTVFDQRVVAVSVVPRNNTTYARERDWIGSNERFDTEAVVTTLRESVAKIAPEATFDHISVGRDAPSGTIANKIRRFARQNDASIVFVGSENAGRIVGTLTVGSSVTTDRSYETMIIPHAKPVKIKELETALPTPPEIQ